jgi:hypothetical protein
MSENLDIDSLLAHSVHDNLKDFDEPGYEHRLQKIFSQREKDIVKAIRRKSIIEYLGKDYETYKEKANRLSHCLQCLEKYGKYKNIKKVETDIEIFPKKIIGNSSISYFCDRYGTRDSYDMFELDCCNGNIRFVSYTELSGDFPVGKDFIVCFAEASYYSCGIFIIFKDYETIDKYEKNIINFKLSKKYEKLNDYDLLLEVYNNLN